ncbi:DUF6082 family protein [Streptomyces sp. NPDC018347]|uniref:DUF6082 family protein n=1 Tax=Streptomyces sp. NPDC018347 TaxID=3157193 RepID=UPI0033C52EEC
MKLITAVLTAGTAAALATAVVGAARRKQDARRQAEHNEAILARNQLDWLAQMSINPDLAKLQTSEDMDLRTPEDMDVEESMQMLKANLIISTLSLRYRLGLVRTGQLPFYASMLMDSDVCRRYWNCFGDLRTQEAAGDERAEHFTKVLDQAAKSHPQAQPTAT